MPSYKYRPKHPEADEFGMVESHLAYDFTPGAAPNVISDIMPDTRHMATGKYYSSKSEFRKVTKSVGCVEVGNETKTILAPRKPVQLSREKRREDIQRAIYEVKNGIQR